MLNAQLVKMLRPKTRARTNIGGRKRSAEEDASPTKRAKLPKITSMPTLDSPMGEASEASQEYATPTDSGTPADTAAKPTSPTIDLSGPPSPYEEPALRKQFRRALELKEDTRVFNIEHTQLWTNKEGKVVQIDLAFKKRPIALFVLFNTNCLVPMTIVDDPWVDVEPPRVIPRVYVWFPYRQPSGTLRSRTVQVSSPRLRGVTVAQAAGILGYLVTQQGWGGSGAISHIRKGARDETPADNKIREVLFLVTHDQDLAQLLIKDSNLDFGFPTKKGLLPSAAEKQALGQREVAVIDYNEQLFVGHRARIVNAITKKLSELAVQQGLLPYGEDSCLVFEKHLGTPRWAPSDNTVESLLQWKRNSNDTVNFYAIFTDSAYGLLVTAGNAIEVDVHLNDDETTDEEKLRETGKAAIHSMQQTTEECLRKVQQAATPAPPVSSATPETKHLLHNIGHELELLNQKAAAATARTEVNETKAAERHQDITSGIRDFHSTYKDTGRAMVDTLVTLTNRLTKTPEEDKQEASSEGGLGRWGLKSANTTASREEGSTQPSLREKVQYLATDPPEVRKAKYDKFIADSHGGEDQDYRGIPFMGPPSTKGPHQRKGKEVHEPRQQPVNTGTNHKLKQKVESTTPRHWKTQRHHQQALQLK
ncbi:hypothetical protein CYMTET_48839 [Cymbomonas tetramitiformis]|uniref:Uncharacterized protein n=1 Tax=Cymbomonas tetramitiformis TaxID=36881 RepID=A0AAE0BT24_9CHLO|nr:hypothetical protein CYMTET_48839 [Cymbomonas tetramitiformis]